MSLGFVSAETRAVSLGMVAEPFEPNFLQDDSTNAQLIVLTLSGNGLPEAFSGHALDGLLYTVVF